MLRRSEPGCYLVVTSSASPLMRVANTVQWASLPNTDYVMNNVFWIGVYPGLTAPMLDFVADTISIFATKAKPLTISGSNK